MNISLVYMDKNTAFHPGWYVTHSCERAIFQHLTAHMIERWIGSEIQVEELETIAKMHNVTVLKEV